MGRLHIVGVPNEGRAHGFRLFEEAKLPRRIARRGGAVLVLPALHTISMLQMDAHDKSFWAAIHDRDPEQGPCLSLMQRQRAKVFVRAVHAELRALIDEVDGSIEA